MKRTSILIAIMLFCGVCLSQNTGYMGNHVIFNADCSLSPSWKNPNPLSQALSEHFPDNVHTQRYLGLNYLLSPNVEVIVWNKGTVGAGYNYYNSPFSGDVDRYFTTSSGGWIGETFHFNGNVTAHGFNVFYKQYLGDTKAPMGYYVKVTFDSYFYKYACDSNLVMPQWMDHYDNLLEQNPELAEVYDYKPVGKSGTGASFGLKAELGYDYLFLNRLRLSFGLTLGSTFSGYKYLDAKSDISLSDVSSDQISVRDCVNNRLLNAYWFGIKLGIGFVAF